MKSLFSLLLVFMFNYSNAQTLVGQIQDSITHKPLDLANLTFVKTNYSLFADVNGRFKINFTDSTDRLLISSIGYNNRIIDLSNFSEKKEYNTIFYLRSKIEELEEVIIYDKKTAYSWDKLLKTNREDPQYMGFQFGTEHCTYIPNPYKNKGKVKSVSLELDKSKGYLKNGKSTVDYVASYSIKFYSYNAKNNKPGGEIYNKNIIIDPKNKTYTLTIAVDSLHIPFPENGICVGVEIINTKYQNPKKTFAFIGPHINFSENRERYPIMSWIRYRNEEEWKFKPQMGFPDRKGKTQRMMIVDLVVNTEK